VEVTLRELKPGDREPIKSLLEATAVFRPEEIEVATELLDHALTKPGQQDYNFIVAEAGGKVAGYACWGPTPGTRGTWDLYWIATDPSLHGKGAGRRLMAAAENDMARRGGRLCVVETSGLESYEKTRRFYLRGGYALAARIADYYASGDDLCIFTKRLAG
jgi:ribosomal protein S18 acetylase RimI-like enzyme